MSYELYWGAKGFEGCVIGFKGWGWLGHEWIFKKGLGWYRERGKLSHLSLILLNEYSQVAQKFKYCLWFDLG